MYWIYFIKNVFHLCCFFNMWQRMATRKFWESESLNQNILWFCFVLHLSWNLLNTQICMRGWWCLVWTLLLRACNLAALVEFSRGRCANLFKVSKNTYLIPRFEQVETRIVLQQRRCLTKFKLLGSDGY